MRSTRALVFASIAMACTDPVGSIGFEAVTASSTHSAVAGHKVTGGGQLVGDDWSETYGITAQQDADGSVRGRVEMQLVGLPALNGMVTCLAVDGSSAWVGGVVVKSQDASVVPVATEFWFRVQDNGQGTDAPDRISSIRLGQPAIICSEQRPVGVPWLLLRGNIAVR